MPRSVRVLVGVCSLVLIATGAVMAIRAPGATGEVMIRAGVMLGAVWLVAPLIRRPAPATLLALAVVALVVLRPRLLLPLAVAAVVWRLASGRRVPSRRR